MRTGRTSGAARGSCAYGESMASFVESTPTSIDEEALRCLACGRAVEQGLAAAASLRCLACREAKAILDPELVDRLHRYVAEL